MRKRPRPEERMPEGDEAGIKNFAKSTREHLMGFETRGKHRIVNRNLLDVDPWASTVTPYMTFQTAPVNGRAKIWCLLCNTCVHTSATGSTDSWTVAKREKHEDSGVHAGAVLTAAA